MAKGKPLAGVENVGDPQKISFQRMAQQVLSRKGDAKTVVVDPQACYFGTPLLTNSLVTG